MIKDIAFINGVVKSREKHLISRETFVRMADSADAGEAFSMLVERGFGGEGFADASPSDYEKIIAAEWNGYKAFLSDYAPSAKFSECIFSRDDFFNAECAVRQKALGLSDEIYSTEGRFSVDVLKNAASGNYGILPEYLAEPMKNASALFENGEAYGAKISEIFMTAYYKFMLSSVGGGVWKENVVFEIDVKNVSVAIRSGDAKRAAEHYIAGGRLDRKTLALIAVGDEKKALSSLLKTPYYDLVRIGFEERKGGSLPTFEKAADDLPMKKLKERRFETEGIVPSLLYAYYKINEIKNVRLVLAMKLAGADKEDIKARLKECYER